MKAPFDIAADLDTPVSAYMKLRAFNPCFLLESVEGGERLARYSFIGLGSRLTIELFKGELRYHGERVSRPESDKAWLEILRDALVTSPELKPAIEGLPFAGGLVGASGYDVVRFFEVLPKNQSELEGLQQAVYVAPESLLVFDHLTRRVALLHSGTEEEHASLRLDIIEALRSGIEIKPLSGSFSEAVASLSQDEFEAEVDRCKTHINAGDIYQIVLSVRFSGTTDLDPFQCYRAVRLLNPSPYMYFLEVGDLKIAGSSPELLADPKENAEHVMLVDLARNDLGRVAKAGSVYIDPYLKIERYSHVMHIVSGVLGQIVENKDAFDLFAATFPAGTLVGAPKVRAMEIITGMEPVGRGLYGGTIGYFANNGNMDQAITIRTLVFNDNEYSFQAGAGIVADSDPAREYEEVLAKSAILRRALKMAQEGL